MTCSTTTSVPTRLYYKLVARTWSTASPTTRRSNAPSTSAPDDTRAAARRVHPAGQSQGQGLPRRLGLPEAERPERETILCKDPFQSHDERVEPSSALSERLDPYQGFRAARLLLLLGLAGVFFWLASGRAHRGGCAPLAVGLAAAAALAYPNFGFFHVYYKSPIHWHETFHYFMGAKYLPELGYTRIYEATWVAGREARRLRADPPDARSGHLCAA